MVLGTPSTRGVDMCVVGRPGHRVVRMSNIDTVLGPARKRRGGFSPGLGAIPCCSLRPHCDDDCAPDGSCISACRSTIG
eukprot:scaffold44_cov411-Prasinococcus_capsulatus_cf.AAC.8